MNLVLMAAGAASRFGENKLLQEYRGKRLFEYAKTLYGGISLFAHKIVVTGYAEIAEAYRDTDFLVVENKEPEKGISHTIHLAVQKVYDLQATDKALMFAVSDQPLLQERTVLALMEAYRKGDKGIASLSYGTKAANPKIFHPRYIPLLRELKGDTGGRQLLEANRGDILYYPAKEEREVLDVDTREDLRHLEGGGGGYKR